MRPAQSRSAIVPASKAALVEEIRVVSRAQIYPSFFAGGSTTVRVSAPGHT